MNIDNRNLSIYAPGDRTSQYLDNSQTTLLPQDTSPTIVHVPWTLSPADSRLSLSAMLLHAGHQIHKRPQPPMSQSSKDFPDDVSHILDESIQDAALSWIVFKECFATEQEATQINKILLADKELKHLRIASNLATKLGHCASKITRKDFEGRAPGKPQYQSINSMLLAWSRVDIGGHPTEVTLGDVGRRVMSYYSTAVSGACAKDEAEHVELENDSFLDLVKSHLHPCYRHATNYV
jgi:hypothetical protein